MKDSDCVAFLQWALPRLGMRWPGFRKVRQQVCKRIDRRMRDLGLSDVDAYRELLAEREDEWPVLDGFCRISISRFYRDRHVFDFLGEVALPELAERAGRRDDRYLRVWSAGSASGEEPYTISLLWRFRVEPRFPQVSLRILATDSDRHLLERARRACYPPSSVRLLPAEWIDEAFDEHGGEFCLKERFRRETTLLGQDIREEMPEGFFDLILCRNLVFTYFDEALQKTLLHGLESHLGPGGALVIGARESLPEDGSTLELWNRRANVYRRK